jgi:hypothetical protein
MLLFYTVILSERKLRMYQVIQNFNLPIKIVKHKSTGLEYNQVALCNQTSG